MADVLENQYINGQWVRSTNAGKFLDVIDSSTAKAFGKVVDGSAEDVNKAVAAARAAFPSWSQAPVAERRAAVQRIHEKWQAKKARAAEVLQRELGCTQFFATRAQVPLVDAHFATALKVLETFEFEERTPLGALVAKEPIGVVGLITPWNYPLNQIALKVVPALLVGCTVVLKPSEVTPICANLFVEAVHEAGLPPGVFNLVHGQGFPCGEALAAHPQVDMISFTGSTRAGRRITELGAGNLKTVRTELGGKSAAVLLDDADFKKNIPEFVGQVMGNSGQSCNALSRMLVPRARYEEAVAIAAKVAEGTKVGRPQDKTAAIGPLVSQVQWERVQGLLKKGVEEGAKVAAGGPGKPAGLEDGFFVKPTIFRDVHNKMTIAQEEIFGPVVALIPYDSEQEAVEIANDTIYGLNNAVGSTNLDRALAVARKLRSGTVMINKTAFCNDAPFGGYKQSGNAREWGKFGFEEFLVIKHLSGDPQKKSKL